MWLVFIILLNLYLLVRIVKTILDILDFFKMKKSAKQMAEIWEKSIGEGVNAVKKTTKENMPYRTLKI